MGAKEVTSSQRRALLPHFSPDICLQIMVRNLRCYLHEWTFISSQKAAELTGSALRIWLQNQGLLCFSPTFFFLLLLKSLFSWLRRTACSQVKSSQVIIRQSDPPKRTRGRTRFSQHILMEGLVITAYNKINRVQVTPSCPSAKETYLRSTCKFLAWEQEN